MKCTMPLITACAAAILAGCVTTAVPDYADQIRAVILCATLIYELVGPVITKLTLKGAGEINEVKKPRKNSLMN